MSCKSLDRYNFGPTAKEMEETVVQLLEHISSRHEKELTEIFVTVLSDHFSISKESSLIHCLSVLDPLIETDRNQYIRLTSKIALEIISSRELLVNDESLKIGTALLIADVPGIILERWPNLFPKKEEQCILQDRCDKLISEGCSLNDFDHFLEAAFEEYFPDKDLWNSFTIAVIKQPSLTLSPPKSSRQTVLEIKFHSDCLMQDVNALLGGKFSHAGKGKESKLLPSNILTLRFNQSQGDLAFKFLEKFVNKLKEHSFDNPALIFAAIYYLYRLRAFYPGEAQKALKINEAIFCLPVGPSISIIEAIEKNYLNFIQNFKLNNQQHNRALLLTAHVNKKKALEQIHDVSLINKVLEILLQSPHYSHLASAAVIYGIHQGRLGDHGNTWAQRLRLKFLDLKMVEEKVENIMEAVLWKCQEHYGFFLQTAKIYLQKSMERASDEQMRCMKHMLYCLPNACQKFPKLKDEIEATMIAWIALTVRLDINVKLYETKASYKKLVDQYMNCVTTFEKRAESFHKKKIISTQLRNEIKEILEGQEPIIIYYKN